MTFQLGTGKSISFLYSVQAVFTLKDYYDNIVRVISSKYSVDETTEAKIRISYIYIVHQRGKGHITVAS